MQPDRSKTSDQASPESVLHWNLAATFPALIAGLVLQMFRMDQHRWIPMIWIEFALLLATSIFMFWLLRRWVAQTTKSVKLSTVVYLAQGGAAVLVALFMIWEMISRSLRMGDANEVVALLAVQYIGWHLAVFSSIRGFEKASLMLCGAIVFFVCCMTGRYDILLFGAVFAVSALWWLAGIYWSRLDSNAIDGHTKTLQIHGTSTAIGTVVIAIAVGTALLLPISRGQISIAGFMPFSGGEEGYEDDFATSGVGDGNMLTAGNNATTTGAVDSNEFIEDDKPSMYDVMADKYDGPAFKRKFNRAVALDEKAKHIHDVKQSEQAGRSFRTMRNTDRETDADLESRISKALFYVEGSVPARFLIDTFQHFDGWDWTKTSIENSTPLLPKMQLNNSFGKPIFKLSRVKSDYLTTSRTHKVKVMRLQSPNLPAPSFLDRWHISRVDNLSLFRWDDAGLIRFDGEAIPPQTVIDVNGYVPNYHVMRSVSDLRHCRRVSWWNHIFDEWVGVAGAAGDPALQCQTKSMPKDTDSPFLQIPDTSSREQIDALTAECTAGVRPGWNQVEAIVNRMREEFEFIPDWETDESVDDTVSHFLSAKGGPQWMFATSCAMMLRTAGYRTRLASGFLVQREHYDRVARQSSVNSDNLHMWPEVCLDGKFWIPLEPTPGFPVPFSTQTAWQWLVAKANAVGAWIWNHPFTSLIATAIIVLSYVYRAYLITSLMLLWWHLVRLLWPRSLLRATRQLIDLRFWAAGDRRPTSRTINSWYTRVEPAGSIGFYDLWNAQNYRSERQNVVRADLVAQCRAQIDVLSFKKIKNFVSENSTMETP